MYLPLIISRLRLPKTQAMVFVQTKDGKFIAVRDADEKFYSLPGGGCYMDETDEECARREVREEAQ
ncbi:MAG: NUDIX hydrolase [Parcubacteria group bacterium]|jgi:ADP-ribose pyrophosphatase YjhB (NUDIX family)|nr:NUDIX hydrolase [Parcubacteria group bacterium]